MRGGVTRDEARTRRRKILALYDAGGKITHIAKYLGIQRKSVTRILDERHETPANLIAYRTRARQLTRDYSVEGLYTLMLFMEAELEKKLSREKRKEEKGKDGSTKVSGSGAGLVSG